MGKVTIVVESNILSTKQLETLMQELFDKQTMIDTSREANVFIVPADED